MKKKNMPAWNHNNNYPHLNLNNNNKIKIKKQSEIKIKVTNLKNNRKINKVKELNKINNKK
jgi:hypothetical protein